MGISVFRTVLLFHGFKLTRTGEDLSRAYGLLTRHVSRLPRRRIPVAIVRGLDASWFTEGSVRQLIRPPHEDLFR